MSNHRILGGPQPVERKQEDPLSRTLEGAVADVDRLVASRPELVSLGPPVASLLRAAFQDPSHVSPLLDPGSGEGRFLLDRIAEGWDEGVPAVRVVTPSFDPESLRRRLLVINACAGGEHGAAASFRTIVEREPETAVAWSVAALTEGPERLSALLEATDVGAAYGATVVRLGLLAEIAGWASRIVGVLAEGAWPHGACPVCGSAPALAEARGLEQRRFLRCGWCAAEWSGARGQCPFCGESDPRSLRYLFAEEDRDRYRLSVCDACGGRLKVIATLTRLSPPGLIVAELAMIHLEVLEERRKV